MRHEGKRTDDGRAEQAYQNSVQYNERTNLKAEGLQEEYDLEPFTIHGGKSKQNQSRQKARLGYACIFSLGEQCAFAPIMHGNPTGPVNFMEEPVHNYNQHNYGHKARCRLHIECRKIVA